MRALRLARVRGDVRGWGDTRHTVRRWARIRADLCLLPVGEYAPQVFDAARLVKTRAAYRVLRPMVRRGERYVGFAVRGGGRLTVDAMWAWRWLDAVCKTRAESEDGSHWRERHSGPGRRVQHRPIRWAIVILTGRWSGRAQSREPRPEPYRHPHGQRERHDRAEGLEYARRLSAFCRACVRDGLNVRIVLGGNEADASRLNGFRIEDRTRVVRIFRRRGGAL